MGMLQHSLQNFEDKFSNKVSVDSVNADCKLQRRMDTKYTIW